MARSNTRPFINYYTLLGIEQDVDEATIRKAYRKRALELHPDKNPDNPKAEELFMAIKHASEVLLDKEQRNEFDAKLTAQKASAARYRSMDETRARMRQELEAREKTAAENSFAARQAGLDSFSELEKLRKHGREAQSAFISQHNEEKRLRPVIPVPSEGS